MYTLQIYFDFSGYSDMALGLGKMFGFHYRGNFNYPYVSRSLTDFWRRWHISLGAFFRDYVYIPLGGNKQNAIRNIIIVWALTGIWHGASWNFVLWGLYFAVILLLEKNIILVFLESLPKWIQHSYSIFLIVLGWAIFYFSDLNRLIDSYKILFGFANVPLYDYQVTAAISSNIYWLIIALALTTPYPSKLNNYFSEKLGKVHSQWLGIFENFVLISISVVFLVGKTYNPFIYFRF
jgi:alginate O-acetyltransferase complex protein AlgI